MTKPFEGDPLAPDAMCKAVESGCLHCIVSVIVGHHIAKTRGDPAQITGEILQVAAELAADTMEPGTTQQTRLALAEVVAELFDDACNRPGETRQ